MSCSGPALLLGPHHNNYDGVASSITSCLSVRLSVCVSVLSKSVNIFVWTIFGIIYSEWEILIKIAWVSDKREPSVSYRLKYTNEDRWAKNEDSATSLQLQFLFSSLSSLSSFFPFFPYIFTTTTKPVIFTTLTTTTKSIIFTFLTTTTSHFTFTTLTTNT